MKKSMQERVTIKVFNNVNNLQLAKSFLESEGITCYTKDEFINQIYPLSSNAVGGMKLQVQAEDVKQAVVLLITGGFAKKEDFEVPKEVLQMHKFLTWLKNLFKK